MKASSFPWTFTKPSIQLNIQQCFCGTIKTLYANGNSSIKLKNGTSRFEFKHGIYQGCPISPYLFLLSTQLLPSHFKASGLKCI